jgi:hypothetical protein
VDGLTFIAIIAICGTVCFFGTFLLAHLNDVSARRHAERMAEIEKNSE